MTFALAFPWHLIWFKDSYHGLGIYNRENPIFAFGIGAMVLQGLVLAYFYPFFYRGARPILTGIGFGLLMGVFLWSVSVLALAAKVNVTSLSTFFTLSSLFHLIQFTACGALIGWIYAPNTGR